MSETTIMVLFIVVWLFACFGWLAFIKWGLDYFFPETSLRDDSAADPDSTSTDRRDTF